MELVTGKPLSEIIKEEAPMDYKRVVALTRQIALGLSVAHKHNIIHRDVKPHNILVTEEGVAKITDFGIAKAVKTTTIVDQTAEAIMGSVHYFSPEQARGGYVDEKSDIYSLGIVMIHRVIFGSVERFIGILTEHFAGKFPLWLAPVQVKLLTVTEKFNAYAEEAAKRLEEGGLRVELDCRNEKIGYKLREARNERVSYIGVIGEREVEAGTLTVRSSKVGELGEMTILDFLTKCREEIDSKAV